MQSDSSDNEIDSPPVKSATSELCVMDENDFGVFEMQPESADSSDIDDCNFRQLVKPYLSKL